jgi:DNA-binding LytR/AlgR family response regulator
MAERRADDDGRSERRLLRADPHAHGMGAVTLRIMVVDDEPVALQRVELALKGLPEVELVGLTDDGRSAIELIRSQRPDIVLLDVQMPRMNGFDVAEALRALPEKPEIIFLTAHDEHAVRAFEVQAADYLLKPVSFARLKEAIRKAGERVLARRADIRLAEMQALLELEGPGRGQAGHDDQLWIRDGLGLTRIESGASTCSVPKATMWPPAAARPSTSCANRSPTSRSG